MDDELEKAKTLAMEKEAEANKLKPLRFLPEGAQKTNLWKDIIISISFNQVHSSFKH